MISKEYIGVIYHPYRTFLITFFLYLAIISLSILVAIPLRSFFIPIIGFVAPVVLLYHYKGEIQTYFDRAVYIEFNDVGFLLKEMKSNSGKLIRVRRYTWDEIKGYGCYVNSQFTTFIFLYFRKRFTKEIAFREGRTEDELFKEASVLSIFRDNIKEYNGGIPSDKQIVPHLGFFNTNAGIAIALIIILPAFIVVMILLTRKYRLPHNFAAILYVLVPIFYKKGSNRRMYERLMSE